MGWLIDRAAGDQLQNRSEFVREAVREKLISQHEPIVPTKAEEREFEEAMRDYRAGKNFYTLDEILHDMARDRTPKGTEKSGQRSKKKITGSLYKLSKRCGVILSAATTGMFAGRSIGTGEG